MLETTLGSNHSASTYILRIFVNRHPYPSAHTLDRAIMSSKYKLKEAKSSKKDPKKEKGKGRVRRRKATRIRQRKRKCK
jgi:hypothetical protein